MALSSRRIVLALLLGFASIQAKVAGAAALPLTTMRADSPPFWWHALPDRELWRLIDAAERDAPSVRLALAKVEEARANIRISSAASFPALAASVDATRGTAATPDASIQEKASGSLSFNWEIDLFGRLRHAASASRLRLDAAEADARAARLSLQTQVAEALFQVRACEALAHQREAEMQSRRRSFSLIAERLSVGVAAPAELQRASVALEESRAVLAQRRADCARNTAALVSLTGDAARARPSLSVQDVPAEEWRDAPALAVAVPAAMLAAHPSVVAAARQADAASADLDGARADRLPSLNLAALLGRQLIRASGASAFSNLWSIGPGIDWTLLDGGRGSANVDVAAARRERALASLDSAVRSAVQDVETGLAQLAAETERAERLSAGHRAAAMVFTASQDSFDVGRINGIELEEARRSLLSARSALIAANRDCLLAWIALVRATGNQQFIVPSISPDGSS